VNILVLIHSPIRMWTIPSAEVERLRLEFPSHTFQHALNDAEGKRMIAEADVVFSSQVNPDMLAVAASLRWIHSPAAGVAGMMYPELVTSDVVVTNSRGLSANTIAEHVIAVTLALFRRLPLAVTRQRDRVWAQDEIGTPPANRSLSGSHVVLIGLGAIGAATASRLHALGATVTGVRRRIDAPGVPGVASVRSSSDLPAILRDADVVVIAAPQTRQTRGLIGQRELAAMKSDAILVNVSRGGLVDEDALALALRCGRIGGAALDVFRNEPLGADSSFWDIPNVLITPHTSGFRSDHWDAATDLFAENLRRFERGDALLNVVDKAAGY
jgi:phosphoglycerate dehydrogenase-like enzyme